MRYIFRKAKYGEEIVVFEMIEKRVGWMNDNDIHQWNDTDYLDAYPLKYYKDSLKNLYVLVDSVSCDILSAAIVFTDDIRWSSHDPSFYIHNFVSSLDGHGAGAILIEMLEELARKEGIVYLRLDSASDNKKLSAYYEKLGFKPCGECTEGKYHGILRQKKIN